jgi:hypothetical protein
VRFAIVAAFAQHGGTFERTTRPTPNRLNVSAFPLEPGPPPNFAPILQLWRRDTPEMPGFVRDHKCKIGEGPRTGVVIAPVCRPCSQSRNDR